MEPAIELTAVSKRYGSVTALRSVDLTVERGEAFGFLGPNGAGKSTAIDILLDYARPTDGQARVLGYDTRRESQTVRSRIGILPDGYRPFADYTARQHLDFAVRSKQSADDPMALLARVGIEDAADRTVDDFSKGMTQRLLLAMALVGDPDLLILDEPSTGLDPNGVRTMREIIEEEVDRGATVFFSSHILDQVERVCDRIGILSDGRLVGVERVEALRSANATDELHVVCDAVPDDVVPGLEALAGVEHVEIGRSRVTAHCTGSGKLAVLDTLRGRGVTVHDFETSSESLESVFAAYTEGGAGEKSSPSEAVSDPKPMSASKGGER